MLRDPNCCHGCDITAGNADIFYWPEPDANTDCLSIVGDEVLPVTYGATTDDNDYLYWGCTSIDGTFLHTIATALVVTRTEENGISWKEYNVDPWSEQPCPETSTLLLNVSKSSTAGHITSNSRPLVIPSSV